MRQQAILTPIITALAMVFLLISTGLADQEIQRPEEVKSMRQVFYDLETYTELARLWKAYYDEYPSEYAYANWMYAARYAGDENYASLLAKGGDRYEANPVLLYLRALELEHDLVGEEGKQLLERAVALDPGYNDPWFALVTHYMGDGDDDRLDLALRHLLESGIITDEVLDYNYNVLMGLEENAILITNGDNDTFPAMILTRLLKKRPDVAVVNRSLLNLEWYPLYMIEQGLPRFVGKDALRQIRDSVLKEMNNRDDKDISPSPISATLIKKLVASAEVAGRPVYFARTLYVTEPLRELAENARQLGLAILVTTPGSSLEDQIRFVYTTWMDFFRYGGLESWRLRHAEDNDGGKMLMPNYAAGAVSNLNDLKEYAPELRLSLFNWYLEHVEPVLSENHRYKFALSWCAYASDLKEVDAWRKRQGVDCMEESDQ